MAKFSYDKVKRNGKEYFRYRHWDSVLRKHTTVLYADTFGELKKKYEVFAEKERLGVTDDIILFGDFCKDWLYNIHLIDKKASTASRYDQLYKKYIKDDRIARIKLTDLSVDDLQKWYNRIYNERGRNIVKSIHKIVNPCIRYGYKTGRIIRNIAEMVIIPKDTTQMDEKRRRARSIKPLTLDEQKRFIKVIEGHRYEALYNTALDTGMRAGELFALTWEDIDFENSRIWITKTYSYVKDLKLEKYRGIVTPPKSEKSNRVIPLGKRCAAILKEHQVRQRETFKKYGLEHMENNLVFCTPVGSYLDNPNVLKQLKLKYKEAGIDDKTFHDLRHTYATRLFELGEMPKTVQELLGHSDVNLTLNTYTHVLEILKTETAAKIDDLYKNDVSPSENVAKEVTDDGCTIYQFPAI